MGTDDLGELGLEASQGVVELAKGTVIVGSMVANNFYNPQHAARQEPPPPPELYDQQLMFVLHQVGPERQRDPQDH